jgi:hypothetical protein
LIAQIRQNIKSSVILGKTLRVGPHVRSGSGAEVNDNRCDVRLHLKKGPITDITARQFRAILGRRPIEHL